MNPIRRSYPHRFPKTVGLGLAGAAAVLLSACDPPGPSGVDAIASPDLETAPPCPSIPGYAADGSTISTFVTYLLNGETLIANVPQTRRGHAGPSGASKVESPFDQIDVSRVQGIELYRPDETAALEGVCPGVYAVDIRTR